MITIPTKRLILRSWRDSDRAPFAALTADQEVMRYFPNTLSRAQSDALITRIQAGISQHQYGFFAAEHGETSELIGFIGVNHIEAGLPFAPCDDIGWRLGRKYWDQGFATEGARAALKYVFEEIGLFEVVAITPVNNLASERVMQKIGMVKQPNNFMHPELPADHCLGEHLLYKIDRNEWRARLTNTPAPLN